MGEGGEELNYICIWPRRMTQAHEYMNTQAQKHKHMTMGMRNRPMGRGYAGEWASLMPIKDTGLLGSLQLFDLESSNLPAREKSE